MNPFFSKQNIRSNEPQIKERLSHLFQRLRECKDNDQVVRIDCAYMALTMDIVSVFAFGINYEHLSHPDFNIAWKNAMVGTLKGGPVIKQFPWLALVVFPMMLAIPDQFIHLISPDMGKLMSWMKDLRKEIDRTIALNEKGERVDGTIFQAMLDSDLPANEKTVQRLEGEGSVVVAAGSETTARCLSVVTFYLMQKRSTLHKLRDELSCIQPETDGFFALNQLETLPYLVCHLSISGDIG